MSLMLFERNAFVVTQSFTLLYRRLAVVRTFSLSSAYDCAGALEIENLRYGRVKLCAARRKRGDVRPFHFRRCI